jgi:NAD(P)-dependent dehydrogenase (short-subunit alcohol dehydrogenase family)
VLVTGAGAGVGRGIAVACGDEGAVVVVASPRENGRATVDAIVARGGSARWVQCDVTASTDVEQAVADAVEHTGGLDVMIHNATSRRSSEPARLEDVDDEVWDDHVSVSMTGAFHCAQAALAPLRERSGSMILMTSPAGMEGSLMLPVYGVVKAALRGFAKSLAREWGPDGVRVNLVSPLAQTPAMVNAIKEDPALADRLARRVPLGRIGDTETDIAPAVVFLASDAARYITGQTLVVDGGRFLNL